MLLAKSHCQQKHLWITPPNLIHSLGQVKAEWREGHNLVPEGQGQDTFLPLSPKEPALQCEEVRLSTSWGCGWPHGL